MTDTPDPARRRLLMRLGLASGAAYVAPVMLHLDAARASGVSWSSRPRGRMSRPSLSRPSRPHRRDEAALRRRLRDLETEAQAALLRRLLGL